MPLIPAILIILGAIGVSSALPAKNKLIQVGVYECGATSEKADAETGNKPTCGETYISGGKNESSQPKGGSNDSSKKERTPAQSKNRSSDISIIGIGIHSAK